MLTWQGHNGDGLTARIVFDPDVLVRPYKLTIVTVTLPTAGTYKSVIGAKAAAIRMTGTKWKWKRV